MQNNNLTAFERELASVFSDVVSVYSARDLEDVLFELFEDADNEFIEEEDQEKRKFLHSTLRKFFRTLDQNPTETEQLKEKLCKINLPMP